ncbi:hypothetical protein [Treponema maltophilum]|uniref:hypothetical protein n=1 Tax=Treponema maltophilum TaxID=51160 RepID=UPI003D9181E1
MLGLSDEFLGQAAVLLLLLPVLFRPFFKKHAYADSTVTLSPLSVVLALLLIAVYGLSYARAAITVIALSVLLINIRALQRFNSRLYVDRYSMAFRIAAVIESIVVLFALAALFVLRPEPAPTEPQRTLYTGSFSRGFVPKREFFRRTSLITSVYEPRSNNAADGNNTAAGTAGSAPKKKRIAVFVPDIKNVSGDSALRLSAASMQGITVFTGDFYEPSLLKNTPNKMLFNRFHTKAFSLHRLYRNPKLFGAVKADLLVQKKAETEALLIKAGEYADSVILVTEGDSLLCAKELYAKYPSFVRGIFDSSTLQGIGNAPSGSRLDTFNSGISLSAELQKAAYYYSAQRADLLFVNPSDSLALFYTDFKNIGGFFAARRAEKTNQSPVRFAGALKSYMEKLP